MQIEFQLERRIGALSENPSGYTKELNVVAWDEKYTKYDLRTWNPNGKPGKGITLTRKTEEKLAKVSRQAEELSMQLAGAAESKKIVEAMSSQRDVLVAEAEELRKSLYNREQETAILEERIKELEEQLKQPVTVATKTEIVEKVPEAVTQELEELRSKLAESENDAGAQKEALELKVEIWAVLNGINKLLEHLDKVQDGKRGAGVCKALASALAQSQNQIAKRLAKFEQEA